MFSISRKKLIIGASVLAVVVAIIIGYIVVGRNKASNNAKPGNVSIINPEDIPRTSDKNNQKKAKTVPKSAKTSAKSTEQLYAEAQKALAAGKVSEAEKLLEEVKKRDPKYRNTETQLDQIEAYKKDKSTGGSGDQSSDQSSSDIDEYIDIDVIALLPTSLSGYITGQAQKTYRSAMCDYQPTGEPDDKLPTRVEHLLITIHQRGSKEGAKDFITDLGSKIAAQDADDIKIEGKPCYFGTDGIRYARLLFADGILVYEFLILSPSGKPEKAYNDITAVGEQVIKAL